MVQEHLFELHFHTAETSPCGHVPANESVRLYHEQGYSGIVVTDHLIDLVEGYPGEVSWDTAVDRFLAGYRAAKQMGDEIGMAIYLGAEIRFSNDHDNDYLVYGLTEEFLREQEWVYERNLAEFSTLAHQNGIVIVQAHPFRSWCQPADPQYLDGIESYNGNPRHNSHNELAEKLARESGRWEIAGSDFHEYEDLGKAAVVFDKLPQSEKEIAVLLQTGQYRTVIR